MSVLFRTVFVLLAFSLFGTAPAKAQNYQSGYVITEEGDTLHGFIKDRKAAPFGKLYSKIKFKSAEYGRRKFSTGQIKAYQCGSDFFRSVWIEDESEFFQNRLMSAPYHGKKQFVKILAEGSVSLWYLEYEDESGIQGQSYFKRSDNYYLQPVRSGVFNKRKQLAEFFSGCPELADKILNRELTDPFEILNFYNSRCAK